MTFPPPNLQAAVPTHRSAPAGGNRTKNWGRSLYFIFSCTPSGPGEICSDQLMVFRRWCCDGSGGSATRPRRRWSNNVCFLAGSLSRARDIRWLMLAFWSFIDNKQMHMNRIGPPSSIFRGGLKDISSSLHRIDVTKAAVVVAVLRGCCILLWWSCYRRFNISRFIEQEYYYYWTQYECGLTNNTTIHQSKQGRWWHYPSHNNLPKKGCLSNGIGHLRVRAIWDQCRFSRIQCWSPTTIVGVSEKKRQSAVCGG